MVTPFQTLTNILNRLIRDAMKYSVPRLGQVVDTNDETGMGKILIVIPILGWDTPKKGAWCSPIDKNAIITPKKDDFVIVQWIDGDINKPVYIGMANYMKDQLPYDYDAKATTQILFQDRDKDIVVKYDKTTDTLSIGKGNYKDSARKDDAVSSVFSVSSNALWHAWFIALNGVVPGYPGIGGSGTIIGTITGGSTQIKVGDK